jgi:glycosyltransferase involved in cell wall biosynthesis
LRLPSEPEEGGVMNIAILLATYNGENYLDAQIKSILCQDYTEWKLFISDDGSTDTTKNIINNYCAKYPEKIMILNNVKRFGNPRDNFFNLLSRVDADLYFFSDQDDVWYSNKMSCFINFYNNLLVEDKIKPLLIHSDLEIVNATLNTISLSFFNYQHIDYKKDKIRTLLVQNIVHGCAMLINRELKLKLKLEFLINDILNRIEMHDWYFALIASEFGSIKYIDKTLIKYRQHQYNIVGTRKRYSLTRIRKSLEDIKKNQTSIKRAIDFAIAIKSVYKKTLSYNTYLLLTGLINIHMNNKIKRIHFLIKNKLLQHGLIRLIKQLFFV